MMRVSQITFFAAAAWVVGWALALMAAGIFGAFKWLVRGVLPLVILVGVAGCMANMALKQEFTEPPTGSLNLAIWRSVNMDGSSNEVYQAFEGGGKVDAAYDGGL